MDVLDAWVTPPKISKPEEELRGRPLELKSYIIESNSNLEQFFSWEGLVGEVRDTGIDTLKILVLLRTKSDPTRGTERVEFYLDKSDKRFWLLHTNFEAGLTASAVKDFVGSGKNELDNAWLSTTMLDKLSTMPGNTRGGYRIGYFDPFHIRDSTELVSENDMVIEGKGGLSKKLYALAESDTELRRALGYDWLSISRGNAQRGVLEELSHDGRFILRRGRSVGDHMILVNQAKDYYIGTVEQVEESRLDAYKENGSAVIRGAPFEFEFSREIDDWQPFLARLFDAKDPFRIWGIKSKMGDGYYRVLAMDMHTGHPLDIEVTRQFLRVYLPKQSCGNVIMRLFVNLQRYFDATITCKQLSAN